MKSQLLPPGSVLAILQVNVDDIAENVVVVGDPARASAAASKLDNARQVGGNREYLSFTGSFRGAPISIVSHGVGAAGAGIAFSELCRAGARRIIRVGTAGGMQNSIGQGEVVIATGAVRHDGLSERLVPLSFPAVADPRLTIALSKALPSAVTGIVLTSDVFYPSAVLGSNLELWQRAGVAAVEMELSALLVIASLNGVAAAGVFAIDGNPLAAADASMDNYQPHQEVVTAAVHAGLNAALEVLAG